MFARLDKKVFLRNLGTALLTAATLAMAGCGDVYVHEEFDKMTLNKSDVEVTNMIGRPTAVDANNPKHVIWTYYAKTVDTDNQNKRDTKTLLILEPDATTHNLKVVKVEYQKG